MITVGGFASRACKIRDFCAGGMFLTPLDDVAQSPFANPGSIPKGDAATIEFSVPIGSDSRYFKLHAVVARAFEGGMGVAFSNPDAAALKVLEGLARIASLSDGSKGASADEAVVVLSRDVLSRRLLPLIQSFFENINERLLLAARQASNNLQQSAHFDAITELEKLKGLIERLFSDHLLEGFNRMGNGQCNPEQKLEDACPAELSLLEKEDLEDLLAIGEIIAKAEPRYQGLLREIEQHYSSGVQVPVDKANNPVGPAAVCHAFRNALRESDIQPAVMQLIYRVFDDCVVAELGGVYNELNTALAAREVLPTAMPRKGRVDPHCATALPGGASTSVWGSQQSGGSQDVTLPMLDAGQTAELASGSPLSAEGSSWRGGLPVEPTGAGEGAPAEALAAARPLHREGLAAHPRSEPAGSWAYHPGAGRPGTVSPNPAYGTARTLLQLARGLTHQTTGNTVDSSALVESTMQLACSARANGDKGEREGALCNSEPAVYPQPQQRSQATLKERLLASLKACQSGTEQVYIPEQRLDDVDFLDQILSTITEDPLVCEDAKSWIQRLAIPLGQTTIMDEKFLSSQSHPANQLINQIAQIKPALFAEGGKEGHEIVAEVNRVIEQIEGEQIIDDRLFAAVQGQLAAVLSKQNELYAANVAQVVKAREEQQAFVKARQKTGKEMSPIVRTNARQISDEWLGWLTQAKRLNAGDVVTLGVGSRNPQRGTLVWVGDGHNPCVFVDQLGKKLATLNLQELAMQLHRGSLTIAAASPGAVVDRAVYASLRKIHERIEHHATHDPVTGLLNLKEFHRYLAQVMEEASDGNRHHVLCWLRLEMDQSINSEQAPLAREELLRRIGDVLRQNLSTNAIVARTGDDAFGALLEDCEERDGYRLAEKLRQTLQQYRVSWRDQELSAAGHVGLVPITGGNLTAAGLLEAATKSCSPITDEDQGSDHAYKAESAPRICQGDNEHQAIDVDRSLAESRLRLTCQRIEPIRNADSNNPHYQVVLCLEGEHGNLLPVNDIAPTALHRKQLPVLDRQIVAQVFRWLGTHKSALRGLGSMAINLSTQSLADASFTDYLIEQFTETKVPPGKICFEIAEKSMMASLTSASSLIRTVKEFGCRFTLDDFGRADASYSFMRELPFNYIKIDGIFVKDIMESSSDFAVVKSINEIGHFMGKKTVAKNVENEEILQRVREIGVDYAQGRWIENRNRTDDLIFEMCNEPVEKLALAD